mgnify:CR=1 FL=1
MRAGWAGSTITATRGPLLPLMEGNVEGETTTVGPDDDVATIVRQNPRKRYPVYEGSLDDIIGVLPEDYRAIRPGDDPSTYAGRASARAMASRSVRPALQPGALHNASNTAAPAKGAGNLRCMEALR